MAVEAPVETAEVALALVEATAARIETATVLGVAAAGIPEIAVRLMTALQRAHLTAGSQVADLEVARVATSIPAILIPVTLVTSQL